MATVKFPSEMSPATSIGGNDKLMISKESTGEAYQATFNQAKDYLAITGIELEPLVGGTTSGTALVVPNGPAGEQRTAEVASGLWYDFGSGPQQTDPNKRWKSYWNGSSWSLKDMGALPSTPADGEVSKDNLGAVTGGEVFNKTLVKEVVLSGQGVNLLDKSRFIDRNSIDYLTGNIVTGIDNRKTTHPVACSAGDVFIKSGGSTVNENLSFYKSDGTPVKPKRLSGEDFVAYYVPNGIPFLAPPDSVEFRALVKHNDGDFSDTIQIQRGATVTDYEPYSARIGKEWIDGVLLKTVDDKVDKDDIIVSESKNLVDKNNLQINKSVDYLTGIIVSSIQNRKITQEINCSPGDVFIKTGGPTIETVSFYKLDGTPLKPKRTTGVDFVAFYAPDNVPFMAPPEASYFLAVVQDATSDTSNTIQIERGETATAYEPYNLEEHIKDELIPIFDYVSENLVDKNNLQIDKGIDFASGIVINPAVGRIITQPIPARNGDIFIKSGGSNLNNNLSFYKNDGTPLKPKRLSGEDFSSFYVPNGTPFMAPPDSSYFLALVKHNDGDFSDTIQIERGDKATAYKPYRLKPVLKPEYVEKNRLDQKVKYFQSRYVFTNPSEIIVDHTQTSAWVYGFYDNLMAQNPDFISKESLGFGSDGVTEIFCYTFGKTPAFNEGQLKNTILLTGGVHGYEIPAVIGAMNFFNDFMNNWKVNDTLFNIRANVRIKFIPLSCPYGWNNNSNTNINNVDINRNFPKYFTLTSPSDPRYSGPSALSEVESQIIYNFIKNNSHQAFAYIDIHNDGGYLGNVHFGEETDLNFKPSFAKYMNNIFIGNKNVITPTKIFAFKSSGNVNIYTVIDAPSVGTMTYTSNVATAGAITSVSSNVITVGGINYTRSTADDVSYPELFSSAELLTKVGMIFRTSNEFVPISGIIEFGEALWLSKQDRYILQCELIGNTLCLVSEFSK